jgi:TBC1 domain family member 20
MTPELEKSPEISTSDGSTSRDRDAFRLQSLAPGGFGDARAYIWYAFLNGHFPPFLELYFRPRLLHLHLDLNPDVNHSPQNYHEEHEPHQDERQIRLDTDRSFVLYPVGDAHPNPTSSTFTHTESTDDSPEDVRLARQAELNKLIVKVFRRRPGLNYFQVSLFSYTTHSPFPPTEMHM